MSTKEKKLLALRLSAVERIVSLCGDTGKTKIQKITYFLQEAVGVQLGYPFRMHYYGPYSDDLDGIVSLAQMMGYIEIKPDLNGFGYHVTLGSESGNLAFGKPDLPPDLEQSMTSAAKTLGNLDTPQLELYASIHLISRSRKEPHKDEVLETVHRLKPKFSLNHVGNAYRDLERAGLI